MQKKNKNLYLCFSNLTAIKHWSCIISIETKIREQRKDWGWLGHVVWGWERCQVPVFVIRTDWSWRLPKSNLGVSVQGNGLTSEHREHWGGRSLSLSPSVSHWHRDRYYSFSWIAVWRLQVVFDVTDYFHCSLERWIDIKSILHRRIQWNSILIMIISNKTLHKVTIKLFSCDEIFLLWPDGRF